MEIKVKSDNSIIKELDIPFSEQNTYIATNGELTIAAIINHLKSLDCKGCTVYITDPHLFQSGNIEAATYESDLEAILKSLEASTIYYFCKEKAYKARFKKMEQALQQKNCRLIQVNSCKIHDRYWICLEKRTGISFGTSINSVCNSISRIDPLKREEVDKLVTILQPPESDNKETK